MKSKLSVRLLAFLLMTISAVPLAQAEEAAGMAENNNGFTATSASFKNGESIGNSSVFKGFGCEGGNLSPQLSWKNSPAGTKSYAITMYDPDAPTGSGWWHWGVYNIPANVSALSEGASKTAKNTLPLTASEIFTDFGSTGYGGPCPPVGDNPHHYILTVYALKTDKLDLNPQTTTGALLAFMLRDNTLAKATITGRYGR